MWIVSPVTKAAASEARKAMTEATSSGVPKRFIGVAATNTTIFELKISGNDRTHKATMYQAEAGAVLSAEVLEQNINCLTGFTKTATIAGTDVADLDGSIRTWSRTTNDRNGLAMYLDPDPWESATKTCTPKDQPAPTSPTRSPTWPRPLT